MTGVEVMLCSHAHESEECDEDSLEGLPELIDPEVGSSDEEW